MSKKSTMTLSDETIEILKNFGSINQNILIKKGNVLQTMATMKNIIGYAEVEEEFPRDFGLYDVNEFLGILKTIKDPVLDFTNDEYLVIENAGSEMKYFYSDPSILVTVPDGFKPPPIDITVRVSEGSLTNLKKISKKSCLPDVKVHSDGTNCYMTNTDVKNSTSNEFSVNVHPHSKEDIVLLAKDGSSEIGLRWRIETLKVIPDDYQVGMCVVPKVSQWVGPRCSYWVAFEAPKPVRDDGYILITPTYTTDENGIQTIDWESMDTEYLKSKIEIKERFEKKSSEDGQ